MKKLLYSILALAGVVATSCTQEHIDVTYDPQAVDAPVINSVTGGDLSTGVDVAINYSEVNYNQPISDPVYSLYVAKRGSEMADKVKISSVDFSKATEGENGSKVITIPAKTLNNLLVKTFKAAYGEEFGLDFQIEAAVKNEKGTAVAGTEVYSNTVAATFVPFEAKEAQPDKDEFAHIWVIGNYCDWKFDKTQFLYDYANDATTFSGVVDFAGKAANGFKLSGAAEWKDDCNWGCDENNIPTEQEPASIQLISSGGSKDIKNYSKRYYHFSFDKSSLVLTMNYGFDSLGIIGVGGDWDNDKVQMEYNPLYCRFYADVTFAAGDTFKVRADGAWTINWGVDAKVNGDNYTVSTAGNYRVYLSLNKGTLEINADMYGKDEPGAGAVVTPDPEPTETTYGLIGEFNGWGEPDVDLVARGDGWYVTKALAIKGEFLIRLNDAWSAKFGFAAAGESAQIGKNVLTSGGENMNIAEGTYDFYFNPTTAELYVANAGDADPTIPADAKPVKLLVDVSATGWTNCNAWIWDDSANYTGGNWPGQALETEQVGDKTYYVFNADASMYGKTVGVIFNNGSEQTADIKGVVLDQDHYFVINADLSYTIDGEVPAPPTPSDIKITVDVSATGWSHCNIYAWDEGNYAGSWPGTAMTLENGLYVWTAPAGAVGKTINIIFNNKVGDEGQQTADIKGVVMDKSHHFVLNADLTYTMDGENKEEEGQAIVLGEHTWGVAGDHNGWSDTAMTAEDGWVVAKGLALEAGKKFKIRADGAWSINYGHQDEGQNAKVGQEYELTFNGKDMFIEASGTYDVYFTIVDNVAKLKLIAK